MAKVKSKYVCQKCGAFYPKWIGKCPDCSAWNSLIEEIIPDQKSKRSTAEISKPVSLNNIETQRETRTPTGISEIDRVLGGGVVPGSIILLGGDPGIGKSTISLQIASTLPEQQKALYISGEESAQQVKLRSERLKVNANAHIDILCETKVEHISNVIKTEKYNLIIIDSIQTISSEELNSTPGSIAQLKECTYQLTEAGKQNHVPILLIGHVNKEGSIAGPKMIEHMVDCVLYFENNPNSNYRIIRSIKNRFGSTNEIGIFEMVAEGLKEVKDPSNVFINKSDSQYSGNAIVPAIEGTRPIMQEIQALVSYCPAGIPRRTAMGIDPTKLSIIIAVIEKTTSIKLYNQDVYVKVTGGRKIVDPACDLAIAAAIISSYKNIAISHDSTLLGEISLSGEIRNISQISKRLNEAKNCGIKTAYIPKHKEKIKDSLNINQISRITDILELF